MAVATGIQTAVGLFDTTSLPALGIQAPPGSVFRYGWYAPVVDQLDPQTPLDLYQIDFYGAPGISQQTVQNAIAQFLPYLSQANGQLVAWVLYEGDGGPQQSSDQICIPGTSYCIPNPLAAQTWGATSVYRLVLIGALTDYLPQYAVMRYVSQSAYGQIPFLLPVAIGIAIILTIIGVIYLIAYLRGQITPQEVGNVIKSLPVPGITPSTISAATVPLLALGLGIGLIVFFVPSIQGNVSRGPGGGIGAGVTVGQPRGRR